MACARAAIDVLIVEDSETDAKLVARELSRSGFDPTWERVDSPRSLREALLNRPFQLVISDSSVLGLGALDALAITRELMPALPFIVVSGSSTQEMAVKAIRMGAADFVSKDQLSLLGPAVTRELQRPRTDEALDTANALLAAQESERRRLARLLHDQFSQVLIAAKVAIGRAASADGRDRQSALDDAATFVDQALEQARDLSIGLWPTVLDDLGLPAAIRWLAQQKAEALNGALELDLADIGRLPFVVEIASYRIVQEALTNVARHAEARTVRIALQREGSCGSTVIVTVQDDGKGFDLPALRAQQATSGRTLGLRGMHEHALLGGGTLAVDSVVGGGTRIRASFSKAAEVP